MGVLWMGLTGQLLRECGWRGKQWGQRWDNARLDLARQAVAAAGREALLHLEEQMVQRDERQRRVRAAAERAAGGWH